ncbi:Pre-mRNA-splicing factor cwc26 [Linderina macrospora]|uniref:Pre-mRNA-splicing factor cwc26 n=1 Tax=Linderina macrospora TaxID=4868 RepID=A0ACC1J9T8_9FUNG|nr:Pre-mRNA-splicing factor cwc26 [Linderina macrospora]
MSLQDYLAKNYGAVDQKKKKKKRPKSTDTVSSSAAYGTTIIDNTEPEFLPPSLPEPDAASTQTKPKAPKFKDTASTWRSIGTSSAPLSDAFLPEDDDERPAIAMGAELIDEIRAKEREKELERVQRRKERHERKKLKRMAESQHQQLSPKHAKPMDDDDDGQPAEHFGLLTADVVKADNDRARARLQRRIEEAAGTESTETVYRDAHGRKIDIEQARQNETERRQRKAHREAMQKEFNKGLVQRRSRSSADTKDLETERKEKIHWDDPALTFLKNKKPEKQLYPEYKGAAPPNRFGIRPGYRWDGVDRSNGFEKNMFGRQASSSARRQDEYAYSIADW